MSANNATTPCILNNIPPPPGDCSTKQHRTLQAEVDNKCKTGKRSCKAVENCAILSQYIQKNWACVNRRKTIANICFRGGNHGHVMAIKEAIRAAGHCERLFQEKCNGRKDLKYQPNAVPIEDKDFIKNISEITGLVGTALIVYILISEGSRLFPPRNFIPIP